jgi:hypothetical protein
VPDRQFAGNAGRSEYQDRPAFELTNLLYQ